MRRGRRARGRAADGGDPYWISFTDLMTAMLAVFILAVVALVVQLTRAEATLAAERETAEEQQAELETQIESLQVAEDIRAEIVQEVAAKLQEQGIEVTVSENNSVLSIPTALLGFDQASHEIRPENQDAALTIGAVLGSALREDDRFEYIDTVFIEGHTDSRAFSGLDGTGNWGLSAFRAISLWQLWEDELPRSEQLDTLERPDGSPLFSVSGYGETRPVTAQQDTADEQAANRRIEIRFTVVQPSAEDLAEILDIGSGDS